MEVKTQTITDELIDALTVSTAFIALEAEALRYAGRPDAAKANEQQVAANRALIERASTMRLKPGGWRRETGAIHESAVRRTCPNGVSYY